MTNQVLQQLIAAHDTEHYRTLTWEGSFAEYLDQVREHPVIAQTAFQRIYRMILTYGSEEYTENKEKVMRYNFFSDPFDDGRDAVYGLDRALMHLVQIFKSAARGYGTEKRVLLLHGPVGSAKSTIVRLLKKGLEAYSKTDEGALYTFSWAQRGRLHVGVPDERGAAAFGAAGFRADVEAMLNKGRAESDTGQHHRRPLPHSAASCTASG